MKRIKYLPMIAVVTLLVATMVFARAKNVTITVNNESTHFTGNVHVHSTDNSSIDISCTRSGYFYGTASANGDWCSINGYVTNAGHVGWAIDPNNDTLKLDFSSSNSIVVTDQAIIN